MNSEHWLVKFEICIVTTEKFWKLTEEKKDIVVWKPNQIFLKDT
jgi:hypothetical protein